MSGSQETLQWLSGLRRGNSQAAETLWNEYFSKLVHMAHQKLGPMPRRAVDGEDVALTAMQSFCRGLQGGQFRLTDRDDLWQLLRITARKAWAATMPRSVVPRRSAASGPGAGPLAAPVELS